MQSEGPPLELDLRVDDRLQGVFATALEQGRSSDALRWLSSATGASGLRRTTSGIGLPLAGALALRNLGLPHVRWTPNSLQFLANREQAWTAVPRLHAELERIKACGASELYKRLGGCSSPETLDLHQVRNVAAMTMTGGLGLCVFDEQGAGKTVTLIFAFDVLASRNETDRLIVIAPKSMVGEWPKDFARFCPGLYRVATVSGTRKEKRDALKSRPDVIVTNYETAIALEDELIALVRAQPGRTTLVVDESFFIKSLDAQRTMAIRRLREWCGRAYVLCGTPAPNSPHDLVQQFTLVDFGFAFADVQIPKDRTAAVPVVQNAIEQKGLYLRHLKADVLPHLPEKSFQRLYVPLELEQRSLYDRLASSLVDELESVDDAEFNARYAHFLARRAALLQVCSNPKAVDSDYGGTPAKLAALDSIVETLVERGEKAVIWSFYTASITAICERYRHVGALRYDGLVEDVAERREAVRRFQEDDESFVFVGNPAAAGAGLTLHRARYAIYESFSNQAAHYLQSLDRIHRRGQERPVEYLILLADQTLEIAEYDRLLQKESSAQNLLGDRVVAPVTRSQLLQEARVTLPPNERSVPRM